MEVHVIDLQEYTFNFVKYKNSKDIKVISTKRDHNYMFVEYSAAFIIVYLLVNNLHEVKLW